MKVGPSVAIIDVDAGLDPAEVAKVAAALQRQVLEHFAPYWGVMCSVRALAVSVGARPDEIEIRLLAKPTVDGALGFHDAKPNGVPIAYVFPALCAEDGQPWSSAASHELLELLGDPLLHLCVELDNGTIWDRENCDRVEADSYELDGVVLSNFNTPECFEPPHDLTGVRFDYLGLSTEPNQVRAGGYAQRFDTQTGWSQVGQMRPYRQKLHDLGLTRAAKRRARHARPRKPDIDSLFSP